MIPITGKPHIDYPPMILPSPSPPYLILTTLMVLPSPPPAYPILPPPHALCPVSLPQCIIVTIGGVSL